jgi:hypothetical protein
MKSFAANCQKLAATFWLLSIPTASGAIEVCDKWSPPIKVGEIQGPLVEEASGVEYSEKYGPRLYHINDSGDGPFFYVSQLDGSKVQKIKVKGIKAFKDLEDIALGKCVASGHWR